MSLHARRGSTVPGDRAPFSPAGGLQCIFYSEEAQELLVGGAGPKRTLPLAARYADAWNVGGRSPEAFAESSRLLDVLVATAGREPRDVRRTLMQQVICFRDESELDGRLRHVAAQHPGVNGKALLDALLARSPNIIAGRPPEVIERIQAYAAAGVEELMVQRLDLDDDEGLQVIAEEVLPHVRA